MVMKKAVAKPPAGYVADPFSAGRKGRDSGLTRISRALAAHLNTARDDIASEYENNPIYAGDFPGGAEDAFQSEYPIAEPVRKMQGAFVTDDVDEFDAADMLNAYRQNRDTQNPRTRDESYQRYSRDNIREAYRDR